MPRDIDRDARPAGRLAPAHDNREAEMKNRLGVTLSRRGTLALFGAASLVPGWQRCAAAQNAAAPLLTRPIPRSGEAMPVIGLGTADVFDVGDDPVERGARAAGQRSLTAGGRKPTHQG